MSVNDVVVLVPTWFQALLPSGERWTLYEVAPLEAVHDTAICEALTGLALTPVGAAGAGGPSPRKMPEITAFAPAVCVTLMLTVPPAATLIERLIHTPCEKSVVMLALRAPEPSLIVTVSRRAVLSQSST